MSVFDSVEDSGSPDISDLSDVEHLQLENGDPKKSISSSGLINIAKIMIHASKMKRVKKIPPKSRNSYLLGNLCELPIPTLQTSSGYVARRSMWTDIGG